MKETVRRTLKMSTGGCGTCGAGMTNRGRHPERSFDLSRQRWKRLRTACCLFKNSTYCSSRSRIAKSKIAIMVFLSASGLYIKLTSRMHLFYSQPLKPTWQNDWRLLSFRKLQWNCITMYYPYCSAIGFQYPTDSPVAKLQAAKFNYNMWLVCATRFCWR